MTAPAPRRSLAPALSTFSLCLVTCPAVFAPWWAYGAGHAAGTAELTSRLETGEVRVIPDMSDDSSVPRGWHVMDVELFRAWNEAARAKRGMPGA